MNEVQKNYYYFNNKSIGHYYTTEYSNHVIIWSVEIFKRNRNRGHGTSMISEIVNKYPNKILKGIILCGYENKGSVGIFKNNGFQFKMENDGYNGVQLYIYKYPK